MAKNEKLRNPGLAVGETIEVQRVTHDGKIWIKAKVVWLGDLMFKAEIGGEIISVLAYCGRGKDWRYDQPF